MQVTISNCARPVRYVVEGAREKECLYAEKQRLRGLPGGGSIWAGKVGASLAESTVESELLAQSTGNPSFLTLGCFCWTASLEAPQSQPPPSS